MKRITTNFFAALGACFVAFVGVATIFPEAWAQVQPRRPTFGPFTQVTDLTVDEQLNAFELIVGSGGCSGCGGTPAGVSGQVQYNNAGAFGAVPFAWDAMNETLTLSGSGMADVILDAALEEISATNVSATSVFANMLLSAQGGVNFGSLQDFADDVAACLGGLDQGDLYHNTGAMRVVLMC